MEYHGGKIEISDNVLKEIVYRDLMEYMELQDDPKTRKRLKKIVVIQRTPEDNVVVAIKSLKVPYGEKIPEYVKGLMEKIKEDIERMTELKVEAVNVQVEDVVEKEKLKEIEEDELSQDEE